MERCSYYDFHTIEPQWQDYWAEHKTFKAPEGGSKKKYYILDMFPYPSSAGLHIGHPEGYTASDILARYKRAKGFNVLHPMGWDAFGLPAEQHALATGLHPSINTDQNIHHFRDQIQHLGFAIDWTREFSTTDPQYYRWTQWIFLQLLKHGLAYVSEEPVWWCPQLATVLANEEVIDGKSERGNFPVERRNLRQWVLKITAYADRLTQGLKSVDWPEATKRQQIAWIGRSEGAEIDFNIEDLDTSLKIFTTRPDTLYGATFMAIAPEHPDIERLTIPECREIVQQYRESVKAKSDLERTDLAKNKTGVFTGRYALNPIDGTRIPIWVADYVLMHHGSGAIMCVPAHDTRDYEFAKTYHLDIKPVIQGKNNEALPFCADGTLINSGDLNGLSTKEAAQRVIKKLEGMGVAKRSVQYKLHDWLFSRQRYWGEPFPILWIKQADYEKVVADKNSPFQEFLPEKPVCYQEDEETWCALPLTSKDLPLRLPEVSSYKPSATCPTPLTNADPSWLAVKINYKTGETCPGTDKVEGSEWIEAHRETNTMPQWAGSCWYYLRFMSPQEDKAFVNPEAEHYWGVPDFYIGGSEHAVLHLLYARFWHQFLYDLGLLSHPEPFPKLFHQGIILGEDGSKMSKSKGNVVDPDQIIKEYGADTLRLYEMFLGPLEAAKPWSTKNIEGVHRFLKKAWRTYVDNEGKLSEKVQGKQEAPEIETLVNETIVKVGEDIENLRFNTAISQLMICLNEFQKVDQISKKSAKIFLQLLAPFAPHIAEELWSRLGEKNSIVEFPWPTPSDVKIKSSMHTIIIQVNGKLRDEIQVEANSSQEAIIEAAKKSPKIIPYLERGELAKAIYVPDKLVNLVVKN